MAGDLLPGQGRYRLALSLLEQPSVGFHWGVAKGGGWVLARGCFIVPFILFQFFFFLTRSIVFIYKNVNSHRSI